MKQGFVVYEKSNMTTLITDTYSSLIEDQQVTVSSKQDVEKAFAQQISQIYNPQSNLLNVLNF